MKVFGSTWKHLEVRENIWKYVEILGNMLEVHGKSEVWCTQN